MSNSRALIASYLWAVGEQAAQLPVGFMVGDRYEVIAPQIWCDTQPQEFPETLETLPPQALPYLRLFPHRLHLPEVYGFCSWQSDTEVVETMLLENVPINLEGQFYPTLTEKWTQVTVARRVYWLWQLLELWTPLSEQQVASSLLRLENLYVQGWRVWLLELYPDGEQQPTLADLSQVWQGVIAELPEAIAARLQAICDQMRAPQADILPILASLNQLLLEQVAQLPLCVDVAGGSDTGPKRPHNEDSCYPLTVSRMDTTIPEDEIVPDLAIVCDGIGGHEGGEVASQLAVRSLKLQVQGLLLELQEQSEIILPSVFQEHLESVVRIVNNLIAAQNDAQGRSMRQRMGTTLVMAIQVPQQVMRPSLTEDGTFEGQNAHELYLVHVGDSRAYWITSEYCHCLTVDDDVSVREVRMGRSTYREALRRPDAGALTQALGTRDADFLHPNVQRFMIEEDGILLLCSDGLSDRHRVEKSWAEYTGMFFNGTMSLEEAVQAWIELANAQNGHDNTSVVLLDCRVSMTPPLGVPPLEEAMLVRSGTTNAELTSDTETEVVLATPPTAVSPVLVEEVNPQPEAKPMPVRSPRKLKLSLAVLLILLLSGGGLWLWQSLQPQAFQQWRERLGIPGNSSPPSP